MKRWLLALCVVCSVSPAHAQVFGQFTSAEVLQPNERMVGAYVHTSENVVGLLAQLRLSFYSGVDFGFQGGFTRQDFVSGDRTTLRLGTDLKIRVSGPTEQMPVTISAGGALGVETGDDYTVLTVAPTVVASRGFTVGERGLISPYASLLLSFSSYDIGPNDSSDFSVPLRLGATARLGTGVDFTAELQFRFGDTVEDNLGFAAGINAPF